MKSWKTTTLGILAAVQAMIAAAIAYLDGNPATAPDLAAVGTTLTVAIGLILARDNSATSESVGAK